MNSDERLQKILEALRRVEGPITEKVKHILVLIEQKLDSDAERTYEEWNKIVSEVESIQKRAVSLAKSSGRIQIIQVLTEEIKDEDLLKKLLHALLKHPDRRIADATERAVNHLEDEFVHEANVFSKVA